MLAAAQQASMRHHREARPAHRKAQQQLGLSERTPWLRRLQLCQHAGCLAQHGGQLTVHCQHCRQTGRLKVQHAQKE